MGEYATYQGQQIKMGTCEDMLYLRADQLALVRPEWPVVTTEILTAIRFRFPFPDEDGTEPGAFDDSDRGATLGGIDIPEEGVDHYGVQFHSHNQRGFRTSLPCPFSAEGKANGLKFWGSVGGTVRIMQQRVWDGMLVTVLACAACGAKYRLPTLADAEPVIVACRSYADFGNAPGAKFWATMADRITAGYAENAADLVLKAVTR
jgi:hypothetical protein